MKAGGRSSPVHARTAGARGASTARSKIKFKIPAGIDRGQRLRLNGEGESGRNGGGRGDLYVVFDVAGDPLYERDGFDLHRTFEVPWPILTLGGNLPIETLYGQDTLKIAPGTPGDKVVKIPNAGVPRLRGAGRGDLYLHLRVAVPQKLTPQQEQLVKELLETMISNGQAPEQPEGFLAKVFGSEKNRKKKKR